MPKKVKIKYLIIEAHIESSCQHKVHVLSDSVKVVSSCSGDMHIPVFCATNHFTLHFFGIGDKPTLADKSIGLLTFQVGQTARLKCNFLSWKPEWKMVWKVNGKVVRIKKKTRFRQRNGKSSLLRIKKVVKADSGIYECIASNDYGNVSKLLNLTVVGGKFVLKLYLD